MDTISISATDLKNNVSDVLNTVYFKNMMAVIERHGKPIAHIIPITDIGHKDFTLALSKTFGSITDFPDVTTERKFRKKRLKI